MKNKQIRQGDVFLHPVADLPRGLEPVNPDGHRIILAYGEVTGHAHAIALSPKEVANAAIRRAQLWAAKNGDRYLEVRADSELTHEEHTAHTIPPGIYLVPTQVDMTADKLPRRVAD